MDTSEIKYILGTSGKPDYMVINEAGGTVLGIKPIVGPIGTPKGIFGTMVGLRLRCVKGKTEDGVVPLPSGLGSAYPKIPWVNVSASRVSMEMGVFIPLLPHDALADYTENEVVYYNALVKTLIDYGVECMPEAQPHVEKWVLDGLRKGLNDLQPVVLKTPKAAKAYEGVVTPFIEIMQTLVGAQKVEAPAMQVEKVVQGVPDATATIIHLTKKKHDPKPEKGDEK